MKKDKDGNVLACNESAYIGIFLPNRRKRNENYDRF